MSFLLLLGSLELPRIYAQTLPLVSLSQPFTPILVKGLTLDSQNPLKFDFIVDSGETVFSQEQFKTESNRLIKYFLAALTVPEQDMWVNLSPFENNRIVPEGLGVTEMGKDMLASDYLLKQLSASLLDPQNELGKEFWGKIYARAGTTEISVETLNRVWIVPDKAVIYEHNQSAFVVERHLKVMLEEDYEGRKTLDVRREEKSSNVSHLASDVLRSILIPALEEEVNTGANFATLRQIYNSMILATWYKKRLRESLLGKVYVDQNKTRGIDVEDKHIKEKIYKEYLEALKKGVANFVKDEYDPVSQQIIPRKYFSGGVTGVNAASLATVTEYASLSETQRATLPKDSAMIVEWEGYEVDKNGDPQKALKSVDAASLSRKAYPALLFGLELLVTKYDVFLFDDLKSIINPFDEDIAREMLAFLGFERGPNKFKEEWVKKKSGVKRKISKVLDKEEMLITISEAPVRTIVKLNKAGITREFDTSTTPPQSETWRWNKAYLKGFSIKEIKLDYQNFLALIEIVSPDRRKWTGRVLRKTFEHSVDVLSGDAWLSQKLNDSYYHAFEKDFFALTKTLKLIEGTGEGQEILLEAETVERVREDLAIITIEVNTASEPSANTFRWNKDHLRGFSITKFEEDTQRDKMISVEMRAPGHSRWRGRIIENELNEAFLHLGEMAFYSTSLVDDYGQQFERVFLDLAARLEPIENERAAGQGSGLGLGSETDRAMLIPPEEWKEGDKVKRKNWEWEHSAVVSGITTRRRHDNEIERVVIIKYGQSEEILSFEEARKWILWLGPGKKSAKKVQFDINEADKYDVSDLLTFLDRTISSAITAANIKKRETRIHEFFEAEKRAEEIVTILRRKLAEEDLKLSKDIRRRILKICVRVGLVFTPVKIYHDNIPRSHFAYEIMMVETIDFLSEEKDKVSREIVDLLDPYSDSQVSSRLLQRMELGISGVFKPFNANLGQLKALLLKIGDQEILIDVFHSEDTSKALILVVPQGKDSAFELPLTVFSKNTGHTHGFSLPIEASNPDTENAKERYQVYNVNSFILAINPNNDNLELAYFIPKVKQWGYIHENDPNSQDRILKKLQELKVVAKDDAMLDNLTETKKVGGIDFNPQLLDLQIKRDGNGVPLPLPQQRIDQIEIQGILPVIINISPVKNLPLLLGISRQKEEIPDLKGNLKTL